MKMLSFILLIGLLQNSSGNVIVETSIGLIEGLEATDGEYNMFMGIPYAKVDPEHIFGDAIPFPTFDDVYQAFDDSMRCPQRDEYNNTIAGNIDCLHMNIYVPKTASNLNKLPVLVSIHGGQFTIGFSGRYVYGPKFLVSQDIILITFNYRLGVYGFMCLDIPEVPGNQGLKDQQLALEWIHNNIEAFGGDKHLVTICGQSAGSMSVDYHVQSPHDRLYKRVIFQAGTTLNPGVTRYSDPTAAIRIAQNLGFVTTDTNEALNFIAQSDASAVILATGGFNFRPCVEKDFGQKRFITDTPLYTDRSKIRDVDVLLGYTEYESIRGVNGLTSAGFQSPTLFSDRISGTFNFDSERMAEMERIVRQFYIGDQSTNEDLWRELASFYSDISFGYPSMRSFNRFIEQGAANAYFYIFSHVGERNYARAVYNITLPGAAHNDEIGYLFDISFLPENITTEDQRIIDTMTSIVTNFVKYGNPAPTTTDLIPMPWYSATSELLHYINISTEISTGMRVFHDRYAFWELFFELNQEYEDYYHRNNAYLVSNTISLLIITIIGVLNIL